MSFCDANFDAVLKGEKGKEQKAIERILLFLSACHTVVIDEKKGYSSASPDELALVNFAKY